MQVLPARGGLGRNVETQAGTLAAEIARRLGGHHRLMHLPDTLTPAAQREIVKLPEIHEVMEMLKRTDVLMYGIGRADDMARNRRMSADDIATLKSRGAVAEAFGYYFDAEGLPVMAATSVGLDVRACRACKKHNRRGGRRAQGRRDTCRDPASPARPACHRRRRGAADTS